MRVKVAAFLCLILLVATIAASKNAYKLQDLNEGKSKDKGGEKPKKQIKGKDKDKKSHQLARDAEVAVKEGVSLFESSCAYKREDDARLPDCVRIQLNRYKHVEVLLPVYYRGTNRTLLVPFLVHPSQRVTTLTPAALASLGVTSPNATIEIAIVEPFLTAHRGDENILGLDYLLDCLLATDFYASQVGMSIHLSGGRTYELNWPLPAFRERKKHKKAKKVFKKHKKLEKAVQKLHHKHLSRLAKLTHIAEEQDQLFHALKLKYQQLQAAVHSRSVSAAPGNRPKTRKKERAVPHSTEAAYYNIAHEQQKSPSASKQPIQADNGKQPKQAQDKKENSGNMQIEMEHPHM